MLSKQLLGLGLIAALTLVIAPVPASLSQRVSQCHDTVCFRSLAKELLDKYKVKKALTMARAATPNQCHSLTHFIGQDLYRQSTSPAQAFQSCNGVCFGGCYHGVIEGYLGRHPSLKTGDLSQICRDIISDPTNGLYQDCLHGLGHGVMALTGDDLPVSLAVCDQLDNPDYCYLGVFMENSTSPTNPDHPSKFIDSKDPLYPCSSLPEKYLKTCYTAQSNYFLEQGGGDWSKTINLCLTVPLGYQAGCINYLGGNIVFYGQANRVTEICSMITDKNLNDACFQGARDTKEILRPD